MNTMDISRIASSIAPLAPQEVSVEVLREKYCKDAETTVAEVRRRVAQALAAHERADKREWAEAQFLRAQEEGFIAGGRINSAVGMNLKATLINCFVQPINDSINDAGDDGSPGIYGALTEAAETMRRGGGVGYDFSRIRPSGSKVRGTRSHASGPVSFLHVFNTSAKTVESAGSRRGAQMGVLRVDHPDIEDFITAKDQGDLDVFNLSVGVTDAFLQAVQDDAVFDLVHLAEPSDRQIAKGACRREDGLWVYRTVRARDLWDKVILSTYDHAEPGVLFVDRMNAENNLYYCETLRATNPCGEQPLPAYGCCDLGSLNLTCFVRNPFTPHASFDFEGLEKVAHVAVRMLDLVLDATEWPLPQQRQEAMNKRRIGLGFLGLGDALVMLGIRYNHQEGCSLAARISACMRDAAYRASIELAKEKGAFPLFDAVKYLEGKFVQRLPLDIREDIRQHGIRNSHLLSIAPTGTISLAFADNASGGIEPAYSWTYQRKKRMPDDSMRSYDVEDHAWRLYEHLGHDVNNLPEEFVTALEMTAQVHLNMMAAVQPFIDTSISKTVNVPADYPYEQFKDLYTMAWKAGLKGLATYRPNAVLGNVLSLPEVPVLPDDDPLYKRFDDRPVGEMPSVTEKLEYGTVEGLKSLYIVVSFIQVQGVYAGQPVTIERPLEFFLPGSQRGDGHQWASSTMRMLSLLARSGGLVAQALQDMRQVVWEKGPVRCGFVEGANGSTAPRYHDSETSAVAYALQQCLVRRGFLDAEGNEVPVPLLARRLEQRQQVFGQPASITPYTQSASHTVRPPVTLHRGLPCDNCGARAMRRFEGCLKCDNCHQIGACG